MVKKSLIVLGYIFIAAGIFAKCGNAPSQADLKCEERLAHEREITHQLLEKLRTVHYQTDTFTVYRENFEVRVTVTVRHDGDGTELILSDVTLVPKEGFLWLED
jgi:hypothetical protein